MTIPKAQAEHALLAEMPEHLGHDKHERHQLIKLARL